MPKTSLVRWVLANGLGLCLGFLAVLQTGFLLQFGSQLQLHWTPQGLGQGVAIYARFIGLLLGGAILGFAQATVLRGYRIRRIGWILCASVGFGLLVGVIWPIWSVGLWGNIPGPVEPIVITVGGGSFAGVFQFLLLGRQGVAATRWLALWICGLILSIVPTALIFILLEGPIRLPLSWPVQVGLNGFVAGAFGALVSGKSLFVALDSLRSSQGSAGAPIGVGAV